MHLSILEDWVDKGRTETLPHEMVEYLEQLNFVNGLWNSCNSPQTIISKLAITYPQLDRITAKSRFEDAMVWFYLDDQVKQDAWRNVLFEKQLKLVDAAIRSAESVDDYNKASLILERAYRMKGLDKEEEPKIPDSAFAKPIKVYSSDITQFKDLPEASDRNLLARYVDEMNITEAEKIRIKQDMGAEPRQLFEYVQQEEDSEG
ncbi:MAG: hypothetical protein AB3N16_02620 [Flavobacteriaceae bacterium]